MINRWTFLLFCWTVPAWGAIDANSPHWFGVGSGWQKGDRGSAVLTFEGGRLWAGPLGTGFLGIIPLSRTEPGEARVTGLFTLDLYLGRGKVRFSALAGGTSSQDDARPELPAFTIGARADAFLPLQNHWALGISAMPLYSPRRDEPWRFLLSTGIQLRY